MAWKYINPWEDTAAAAAAEPQRASASSPPLQHLAARAKSGVCVSEMLDSALWEHMGWGEGRRRRQDAEHPQRHSNGVRPVTQERRAGSDNSQHQLLEKVGNDLQRWQMGICFASSAFPFEGLGLLPEQSICTHTCIG